MCSTSAEDADVGVDDALIFVYLIVCCSLFFLLVEYIFLYFARESRASAVESNAICFANLSFVGFVIFVRCRFVAIVIFGVCHFIYITMYSVLTVFVNKQTDFPVCDESTLQNAK